MTEHTEHCLKRQKFGDGECDCSVGRSKRENNANEGQSRLTVGLGGLSAKATLLEKEAVDLLNGIFLKLPSDIGCPASDRLVECIVSAAVLRVSEIMQEALLHRPTSVNP